MQYCANIEQPLAIHNVLADVVHTCGGSRVLLHILNQLGCTTSADTHDRFVTTQATALRKQAIWNILSPHIFTIASADNFDMLQSNAAVFCGDQTRSYHGTTIQVVQPNPALTVACTHQHVTADIATAPPQACQLPLGITNTDKRVHSNSPASSPHSLGKEGPKRKRTLSPHTFKSSEKIKPILDALPRYINALSWNDFIESDEEQHERVSFECNMFAYNTLVLSAIMAFR